MATEMTGRTVTVIGAGAAAAVPDRAVLRVSAGHRAAGVAAAFAGADAAVKKAVAVAGEYVAASRVASTELNVWPAHRPDGAQDGFEARHALRIDCPDLATAESLLGALAARIGDALNVDGVTLEVDDPSGAAATAREAAFADARAKGLELAGYAGTRLGGVVSILEGGASGPGLPRLALAADQALQPGERDVTATLTVTWSLLD